MIEYIALPIIGGLIGWVTNYVAVQLLFRPVKKKKLLFFTLQGVIPKKKKILSKRLSKVVEDHFFTPEDLRDIMGSEEMRDNIIKSIKNYTNKIIKEKVPNMLQGPVLLALNNYLRNNKEKITEEVIKEVNTSFQEQSIAQKIEKKLHEISEKELNRIVRKAMRQELKHIEIMGGIIGFVIGGIQLILI